MQVLHVLDIIFISVFAFEAVLTIISKGLLFNGPESYLRNAWNVLDFTIVVVGAHEGHAFLHRVRDLLKSLIRRVHSGLDTQLIVPCALCFRHRFNKRSGAQLDQH